MKQKSIKIAACFLVGVIAFSSINLESGAAKVSSVLPAAGVALILEEGTSLEVIQQEIDLKINVMSNNQVNQIGLMTLEQEQQSQEQQSQEQQSQEQQSQEQQSQDQQTQEQQPDVVPPTNELPQLGSNPEVSPLVVEIPVVSMIIQPAPAIVEEEQKKQITKMEEQPTVIADAATIKVYNVDKIDFETALKALRNGDTEITEDEDFSDLLIANVNDFVNVRSIPSTDGEVVGKLYGESVGRVISKTNDGWYEITSGSVTGFVKAEYCIVGDEAIALVDDVSTKVATVAAINLNVRSEPNTDSSILKIIPMGEDVLVIEELDGWVKVSVGSIDGYVSSEYVSVTNQFITAESKEEEAARLADEAEERRKQQEEQRAQQEAARAQQEAAAANNTTSANAGTAYSPVVSDNPTAVANENSSEIGLEVANFALQFVGNPYVYGGTSLTEGADCSGFVLSVYANFGVKLPHSAHADRKEGYAVEGGLDNAQPGDLICYDGHIGIYIGGGQIVHASTRRTGIKISDANYKKIAAIRRIF